MSVALDTALYIREQKLSNPLTLAERGVLFTLMFRVGSNPHTWVSQKDLCIELDITDRPLRHQLKKLEKKGLLVSMSDADDKRKNLYRPAEFLINYHQNPKKNPTKSYPQKARNTKKYRSKTAGTLQDTGRKQPVYTGRKQPVINCANDIQDNESKEKKVVHKYTKGKYKTKDLKQKEDSFFDKPKSQEIRNSTIEKSTMSDEYKNFDRNKPRSINAYLEAMKGAHVS